MGQSFLNEHMLIEIDPGDHGSLAGLGDDDHTGYHTAGRHKADHSVIRAERGTSTQTIGTGTTVTIIVNTIIAEDDAAGDFSLNTSTGELTIANAGWYQVDAGFIGSGTTAGDRILLSIVRNDSQVIASVEQTAASTSCRGIISTTYKFSASDKVETTFFHAHGSDITLTNSERTFLCVRRVA